MRRRKVPNEISVLSKEFVSKIGQLYGDRLNKVILFGSYARGEQREDSDVDFLVVLNDIEVNGYKEIDYMVDTTFDLTLKYAISVSAVPVSINRLLHQRTPLTINAYAEGILL